MRREREREREGSGLFPLLISGQGPTLMTPFNLIGPTSNAVTSGVRTLTHNFWGGHSLIHGSLQQLLLRILFSSFIDIYSVLTQPGAVLGAGNAS